MVILWAAISCGGVMGLVVLWQRLGKMRQVLAAAHTQLAEAVAWRLQAEQSSTIREEQLANAKKIADKLTRESVILKEKLSRAGVEIREELRQTHTKVHELEEKLEHHQSQERALLAQLQGHDQTNKEFRQKLNEKLSEAEQQWNEQKAGYDEELRKARSEQRTAEQSLIRLKKEFRQREEQRLKVLAAEPKVKEPISDTAALEKMQGRLQQAEKLYQLMRSHKEITAERNDYLVTVCNILATAVIEHKQPETTKPETFGPLVSMAINLVRAQESAHAAQ